MCIVQVTLSFHVALARSMSFRLMLSDVLAAAVETETLGTGLLSIDFSGDLKYFLIEFWQVVLLEDPVNALEDSFK
jgi:hypothetical protein